MTAPATGSASGFATNETTGTDPKTASETGNVPSCAANVDANTPRPPQIFPSGADNHARPAVAPTDNANPMLHASIGSIISRHITDIAKTARAFMGCCRKAFVATAAAIKPARSTDGSARVNTMKHPMMQSVINHFTRALRRRINGVATANK
jgi:hypothetical protein